MNDSIVARLALVLSGLSVLAPSGDAAAQSKTLPSKPVALAAASAQIPEYYEVGGALTLDQVFKLPEATKIMGPDCKLTTVGELKKIAALHQQVKNPPKAVTGGTGKSSFGPGVARLREASSLVAAVSGEAQASRPATTGPGRPLHTIMKTPGIATVNGKSSGFRVTPGAYLTINGDAFGDTMGQANLIGNFPGGAAALRVVDWKAESVYALLPAGLTGVVDQNVSLQLVTSAGKTYRHDGGSFVATRAPQTETTNIPRFLKFTSGPTWNWTMDASGAVNRVATGEHINCAAVGADTLTLVDLPKGFVVTEVDANWTGRTDSGDGDMNGDGGSRTYAPGYGFGDWTGNSVPVRWGVWRNHTSPYGAISGGDMCLSTYQISLIVVGPAGVSPF